MTLHALKSSLLSTPHGFFTRKGGISNGFYASLNCGPGSQDSIEHVLENRLRVQDYLNAEALCTLYQIHSAEVITITQPWQQYNAPRADAMVTKIPGIALGILTADCAPVLLADTTAGIIGAAHAGWKGAVAGVIPNTIAAMRELGSLPENIIAALGPCIAQESYQVDVTFHSDFLSRNKGYEQFFTRDMQSPSHYYFDLKSFVAAQLQAVGVTTIDVFSNNTYIEESEFFSYRRATHRNEQDYGRQISAIVLTGV